MHGPSLKSSNLPGLFCLPGPGPWTLNPLFLLVAIDDAAAVQVIRAELDGHAVAGKDADEVLAHAAGDVREDLVLILELDLEQRVGQGLDDRCHYFNRIFLRQTLSSEGPIRCAPRVKPWFY